MKENPLSIFASGIGYLAEALCRRSTSGSIIGATSSGVFIMGEQQRVLFLAFQNTPGPWTVVFSTPPSGLIHAAPGMQVTFSRGSISIDDIQRNIDLSLADTWQTPAHPDTILPVHDIRLNLQKTVSAYMSIKEPDGLAPLLPFAVSTAPDNEITDPLRPAWNTIRNIRAALETRNGSRFLDSIQPLIGQGRGLTPAGDDCITGILLGLERSTSGIFPHQEFDRIKQDIITYAFQHTTALSASQIEAASEGSADNRLLTALDGLLTGNTLPDDCARLLGEYGHSSGGDALLGFSIAQLLPLV
jgi:hypothetical protein